MNRIKHKLAFSFFICIVIFMTACDDPYTLEIEQGTPNIVVDGWIRYELNNPNGRPDTVKLTTTDAYFANRPAPVVSGARVIVLDGDGRPDTLLEIKPGIYITQQLERKMESRYTLIVQHAGEEYRAEALMKLMVPADSLRAVYSEASFFQEEGFKIFYYGNLPPGRGNHYWFKTIKNDTLLAGPDRISVTDDRFLNEGGYIDSVQIIFDVFKEGDKVEFEIWSLEKPAFDFLSQILTQTNNGGLFATPPANVPSNIKNVNPKSPKKAVGFFGASGINSAMVICKK